MSRTKRRLYIAYGSNLNFEQMARRCPTAQAVGTTVMKNWQLLFRGETKSAVATVERFRGGFVPVLVWQLQPQDETALDRYEGWPYLYHKETVRIRLKGNTVSAMIYIMNEIRPYGLPSPFYLNIIREGYVSSGFDVDTLYQAVLDSKAAAKRSKNA